MSRPRLIEQEVFWIIMLELIPYDQLRLESPRNERCSQIIMKSRFKEEIKINTMRVWFWVMIDRALG